MCVKKTYDLTCDLCLRPQPKEPTFQKCRNAGRDKADCGKVTEREVKGYERCRRCKRRQEGRIF